MTSPPERIDDPGIASEDTDDRDLVELTELERELSELDHALDALEEQPSVRGAGIPDHSEHDRDEATPRFQR